MPEVRLKSLKIENYRSFGDEQTFCFPGEDYKKPVSIVGYNNSGKSNLMNSILYALQVNYVARDTFTIHDFHNKDIKNKPFIELEVSSSVEPRFDGQSSVSLDGTHKLEIFTDMNEVTGSKINSKLSEKHDSGGRYISAFGAVKYFNIFYINFHKIKEEISIDKTSWGNLKSFLSKHIHKTVNSDSQMGEKRDSFEKNIRKLTNEVKEDSKLADFILKIQTNYKTNLRDDSCTVEFGLPDFEDIFLKMMFSIGLNSNSKKLVPLDQFGDGFISMFVMAVIKSIGEANEGDECVFLFEEPESFLHENHQEYFYKTVLCELSKKHQVIYTTHSDKMVDIFDTQGLIRLEMDSKTNQTINKYNKVNKPDNEIVTLQKYNPYIKTIEPNLNKILFSKKVILVEGPNDVLVYKHAIKQKILELIDKNSKVSNKDLFADTYLNFENTAIVCHHGKSTALYLIELCKWFGIDYFTITDWDISLKNIELESIKQFKNINDLKNSELHKNSDTKTKAQLTNNFNLLEASGDGKIHFNFVKLEDVIRYEGQDKDSFRIWEIISNKDWKPDEKLFPKNLSIFLEFEKIKERHEQR